MGLRHFRLLTLLTAVSFTIAVYVLGFTSVVDELHNTTKTPDLKRLKSKTLSEPAICSTLRDQAVKVMEDQRQSSLFNPPDWGWAAVKGTPQLSSECQTYQSQFNRFQNSSFAAQLSKNHHTCQSTSTTAIILRLHTGSNLVFSPDMIHFIRSLITEAGYTLNHSIHLLVHHNHNSILTPSEKQSALKTSPIPQEFHAICTLFTDGEMKQEFGDLVQGTPHSGDPNLALLWFLKRNTRVEFAWILEDDVRYIGRWRDLFAQVQDVWAKSRKNGKNREKIPDLVAFEDICEPVEDWVWWKTCESIWGREKQRHTMGVIWGWSRGLVNAMLEHIQAKENCYYEVFPPSVAHNHGLSSLFIPHTMLDHPETGDRRIPACPGAAKNPLYSGQESVPGGYTFSVNGPTSLYLYAHWKQSGGCFPNMLLHPVKSYQLEWYKEKE